MSNSSLVSYTKISPNKNSPRNHAIDRITPHCVVGQLSAESICGCFTKYDPQDGASCNYGIGTDGRVSLCVEEKDRSWCSSSGANDHRAVTIECASDMTEPYAMNDRVYSSLVNLCTDICKRNGKNKLLWFGEKNKTLAYEPKSNEMVITVHRWFANKSCPGNWLYARLGNLAAKVTENLNGGSSNSDNGTLYRVQVGAYHEKANADAQLAKVKAAGFDTYMIQVDGLYKIQVGAYKEKSNADAMLNRVKAAGFDAFITTKGGSPTSSGGSAAPAIIKAGSRVKLKSGAKTYTGGSIAGFVFNDTWIVSEVVGSRAVIDKNVGGTNSICTPVNVKDLTLV